MSLHAQPTSDTCGKVERSTLLTYVSDASPGIRRLRCGSAFHFRRTDGSAVRDQATLRRIRSLAIPPAWSDVWICPTGDGHIQAIGRDAKGRKQYLYHPQWRELRDADKYGHMLEFARRLPCLRARVARDMARPGRSREKVLATVVDLLDKTLIRVGNHDYARENGSYGLTTLRNRHVRVNGDELRFCFKGKSGKAWRLSLRDRRIVRVVRQIQELPGQHLFQYVDDAGAVRAIDSADVNDYLRECAGPDVSTKDFRTWAGSVLAALALRSLGPARNATHAKSNVSKARAAVAARLGNTPAVCRRSYVHPLVIEAYQNGGMDTRQGAPRRRETPRLPPEEEAVLRLLERGLASRRQRQKTVGRGRSGTPARFSC